MDVKVIVTFQANVMHQEIEVKLAFEGQSLSFIPRVSSRLIETLA